MKIRAMMLAGVVGLPFFAGAALPAQADTVSLVNAAKQGDREAVRSIVNGPAKKDVKGADGIAALVWASSRNDAEMVDLLIKAGANVKGANEFGATPVYAAAALADPAMTVKLIAAGADPSAPLMSGETPLMEAAGRGNVETVKALLKGGANPNATEAMGGQTALMWAIAKKQPAVVDELVKYKADVNLGSKTGFTPLMFAAQQDDVDSARILIKAGANVNEAQPKTGVTPLLVASAMAHAKTVNMLLDSEADPNAVDSNGYAPLHRAVRDSDYGINFEHKEAILVVVKSLLKHGADPNLRIHQDKAKAADEIKKGANAFYGKRTAVTVTEILLPGSTPLVLASETSNLDVVKALMEAKADPNIPTDSGTTALIMTAGAGTDVQRAREPEEQAMAVQTAKYLVEHGADVNARGQFGWTPIHAASYQGLNEVISYLVSKGANINAKDDFGQTPLSISLSVLTKEIGARRLQIPRRYREDTAKLILKLGATPLDKSGVVVVLQRTGDLELGRDGTQE